MTLGLLFDLDHAYNSVEMGPPADSSEVSNVHVYHMFVFICTIIIMRLYFGILCTIFVIHEVEDINESSDQIQCILDHSNFPYNVLKWLLSILDTEFLLSVHFCVSEHRHAMTVFLLCR